MVPEWVRFTALVVIGVLVLLDGLVPLFGTVLPLWRRERHSSVVLILRVLRRLGLFLLLLIQVMFSARALGFVSISTELARDVTLVVWIGGGVVILASWLAHPTGARGL